MPPIKHPNRSTREAELNKNIHYSELPSVLRAAQDLALAYDDCRPTDDVELIVANNPRPRLGTQSFGGRSALGAPIQNRARQGMSSPFDGSALDSSKYGSPDAVLGLGSPRRAF